MALLTGIAVSRSLRLLKHDKTIELFLALPILGQFLFGALASLIGNGSVWFGMSPTEASSEIYQANIYTQLRKAAEELGQKSEVRNQDSEVRGQKSEGQAADDKAASQHSTLNTQHSTLNPSRQSS